jgi:hypothetical protein
MPFTPSSFQFAQGSEDLGTLHGADYRIDLIGTFRDDRMDKVAASSYDPTAGCSSATTYNRSRIAYDNRSHPVVRLLLFIGSGYEWQALAGPPHLHPVFWHLVGINKSLEYRFGASLG